MNSTPWMRSNGTVFDPPFVFTTTPFPRNSIDPFADSAFTLIPTKSTHPQGVIHGYPETQRQRTPPQGTHPEGTPRRNPLRPLRRMGRPKPHPTKPTRTSRRRRHTKSPRRFPIRPHELSPHAPRMQPMEVNEDAPRSTGRMEPATTTRPTIPRMVTTGRSPLPPPHHGPPSALGRPIYHVFHMPTPNDGGC